MAEAKAGKAGKAKKPARKLGPEEKSPAERAAYHERKARELIDVAEFHAENGFNRAALAAQRATAHGLLACAARLEAGVVAAAVLSARGTSAHGEA